MENDDKFVETQISGGKSSPEGISEDRSEALQPGSFFTSRYAILSEGISGGMGAVYKCKDERLNRIKALKIMHRKLLGSPEALQRFRTEVAISQELKHENIVTVYDMGEHEELEFFTMEWIEGRSLRDLINERIKENKPFTFEEAHSVVSQLLDALAYSHKYTVHRDVKPENILIVDTEDGLKVKLTDFGLAKMFTPSQFITTHRLGTAYYMAPEQQSDPSKADKRADIFSVGIILFELLTLRNIAGSDVPSVLNNMIPPEIDDIYRKAAAVTPERRYNDAQEFKEALDRIRTGQAAKIRETNSQIERREMNPAVDFLFGISKKYVVAVILVIAIAVGWGLVSYSGLLSPAEKNVLKGHTDAVTSVAFLPDGNHIVSGSRDRTIKLWSCKGHEIRTFRGHNDQVTSVAISSDGKHILSGSSDDSIKLWDISSGKEAVKFEKKHADDIRIVAFSPDGKHALSAGDDTTLRVWDIATGKEVKAFTGHAGRVRTAAFSPDGKHIVSGGGEQKLVLWDIDKDDPVDFFTGHSGHVRSVAFSPRGDRVISGSDDGGLKIWDVETGEEIRPEFKGHEGRVYASAFSPDGITIASGGEDRTVRIWNALRHVGIRTIRGHEAPILAVAFSPDRKWIASAGQDKTIRIWKVKGE